MLTFAALSLSGMLVAFHVRGRSSRRSAQESSTSNFLFLAGVALFALSSTWPLESFGERYFAVHQLEFVAIRIAAPMLIVLSHPSIILLRGVPSRLRSSILKPVLSNEIIRNASRTIRRPTVTLLLYGGSLLLWAIPALQDRALTNACLAILLHISLFLSGLLFWSRIFDARGGPRAVAHGVRLMMLWLAILEQIAIGSAITLKSTIWYPAYGGRLSDQTVGGILLWIPGSMLTLLGLLTVIHMWGRHETQLDLKRRAWSPSNSAILLYPETAVALRAMAAPKNRRMAFGLTAFVLFVFLATMGEGIGYHL